MVVIRFKERQTATFSPGRFSLALEVGRFSSQSLIFIQFILFISVLGIFFIQGLVFRSVWKSKGQRKF